jgi:GNAT superfamily N-acetyltransferase
MEEGLRVRAALPTDRARLHELWIDLIEYHQELDPDYRTVSGVPEAVLGEIDRALASPTCRLLVAERDGRVVGFLFGEIQREQPRPAWIHELYVESPARRRGIAAGLVDTAERWFDSEKAEQVFVRVETANRGGLDFWKARGFGDRARILERTR